MASVEMNAEMKIRTLIALTEELTSIFVRENACLVAGRPQEIVPLQEDKARLAAAYQGSIRGIAADRMALNEAAPPLLEKLREVTAVFEQRAAEQHALLETAAGVKSPPSLRLVDTERGAVGEP